MISIHVFTLSWQNIEKSLNQAWLLKTSHYWAKVDVCGGVFVCFAPQVSQVFHVSLRAGIAFVKVLPGVLLSGTVVSQEKMQSNVI